jgi:biotin carboxyl carrier protein
MAPRGERFTASIRGETAEVTLSPDGRVTVAGIGDLVVREIAPGEYSVTDGDATRRVFAVRSREGVWIFAGGESFRVDVVRGDARRPGGPHHHDTLAAPMPATVVKILVDAGARVARGETLVLLEAMKMELPLRAPAEGVVQAINCREGELVAPGFPLVELED